MGVESVNFGNMTTSAAYADAMKELMSGEKPTGDAISVNDVSVAVEGAAKGSGTNTPLKISQASNTRVSDFRQELKGDVVEKAVKTDAATSKLLNDMMAEVQSKV